MVKPIRIPDDIRDRNRRTSRISIGMNNSRAIPSTVSSSRPVQLTQRPWQTFFLSRFIGLAIVKQSLFSVHIANAITIVSPSYFLLINGHEVNVVVTLFYIDVVVTCYAMRNKKEIKKLDKLLINYKHLRYDTRTDAPCVFVSLLLLDPCLLF